MVHLDQHYVDRRLVELYDRSNPHRADTDFYLQLAADLDAHTIIDLGCGTGLLTCQLATNDRQVIGVDPAPAMLAVARRQLRADHVHWIEGDSQALGTPHADLVLMTGNVAQVFLDDMAWATTLDAIHTALRPGGYLAFESRNPAAREWEQWTREATYEKNDTPFGSMEEWIEVVRVHDGRVQFEGHNVFTATGEVVVVNSELRFRSLEALTTSLVNASFTVEQVYGNWQCGPVVATSHVLVFVARRT